MISACRRLMVIACEDVGLAYPQVIPIVKACVDAANMLGMLEARIPPGGWRSSWLPRPSPTQPTWPWTGPCRTRRGKGGDFPRHLQNVHADSYTMGGSRATCTPMISQPLDTAAVPAGQPGGNGVLNTAQNKLEQAAKRVLAGVKNRNGSAARGVFSGPGAPPSGNTAGLGRHFPGVQLLQDRELNLCFSGRMERMYTLTSWPGSRPSSGSARPEGWGVSSMNAP